VVRIAITKSAIQMIRELLITCQTNAIRNPNIDIKPKVLIPAKVSVLLLWYVCSLSSQISTHRAIEMISLVRIATLNIVCSFYSINYIKYIQKEYFLQKNCLPELENS